MIINTVHTPTLPEPLLSCPWEAGPHPFYFFLHPHLLSKVPLVQTCWIIVQHPAGRTRIRHVFVLDRHVLLDIFGLDTIQYTPAPAVTFYWTPASIWIPSPWGVVHQRVKTRSLSAQVWLSTCSPLQQKNHAWWKQNNHGLTGMIHVSGRSLNTRV